MEDARACICCGRLKPESDFYFGRNGCMECVRRIERQRYWQNVERRREVARAYMRRIRAGMDMQGWSL